MKKTLILFFSLSSILYPQYDSLLYELYLTQISSAEAFLRLNQTADAKEFLSKTDSSLRGWEYDFLKARSDRSNKTLTEHKGSVASAKFSPDDKLLATGASDSVIILWNTSDYSINKKLKGHTGQVSTLDFSPDGTFLASGSTDKTVKIWDVKSGRELLTISDKLSQGIYCVKVSPDGRSLGVTSWYYDNEKSEVVGFGAIYNLQSGKQEKYFYLDPHPASVIDFSPDGKRIFIAGWGMIGKYFDLESDEELWEIDLSGYDEYSAFQFADISPDGKRIAVCGRDDRIRMLDAQTGEIIFRTEPWFGHKHDINSVRFTPDGKYLLSASSDQLVILWEAETGTNLKTFRGHTSYVNRLDISSDGKFAATPSKDGSVKIWKIRENKEFVFDVCENGPWYAPVNSEGNYMAAACSDKEINIWDLNNGQVHKSFKGYNANAAVFTPDGKYLYAGGHNKLLIRLNIEKELIDTVAASDKSIYGIDYLPEMNIVATASSSIKIWDAKTLMLLKELHIEGDDYNTVKFSPDGEFLFAANQKGMIIIWKTQDWKQLNSINTDGLINYFVVSPDGKLIMAGYRGGKVSVWDWENEKLIYEFKDHKSDVWAVAFSPDNRYAASASYDKTVKIWDLKTGRCTLTLGGFEGTLFKVDFFENGNKLMVTESEGKIFIYEL